MSKLKRFLLTAYVTLFFAICIIPIALFPVVKNSAMIEKKELAAAPQIIKNRNINTEFSGECNSYISDHFPFRSELLFAANHMLSDVFKSNSANVITGKSGWLFYEETADDYMGTNLMSEEELNNIVITLDLINEAVKSNGGDFVFAPIPNKNSIYSSYMPDFYSRTNNSNLDRLYNKMNENGISYVNLKQVFTQASTLNALTPKNSGITYYHKKDSHWNNLGAELGYNVISNALNSEHVPANIPFTASYSWDGDLEKLLYPRWFSKDIQYDMDYQLPPYEFISPSVSMDTDALLFELMSDKEENDTLIVAKHLNQNDSSELYMVRDSFGRALLPFMISEYDTSTFARTNCPYIATLNEGCDVVYEIVERNLENIVSTAPYMYAPLRENIPVPNTASSSEKNTAVASDEGYAYRLYGTIDKNIIGSNSRIYVRLSNENETYIFEAFPIYENNLPGEYSDDILGYSLMLNSEDVKSGDYDVQVFTDNGITESLININIVGIDDSAGDDDTENAEEDIPIFNAHDFSNTSGFELILEKSAIVYNYTEIHLNDNIDSLTSSLGKMSAPSISVESCITGTTANEYYYPSLTISTLEDGTIFSIDVADNGYKGEIPVTTTGITLGSAPAELDELIGSDYLVISDEPLCYSYSEGSKSVFYTFDGKSLSDISIVDTGYQAADEPTDKSTGKTKVENGKYVVENYTNNMYGWRFTNGVYEYYDRNTGERVLGSVVNGIPIGADGSISHDSDTIARIDVMMKARWVIENNTLPTDSLEEKRLKVFNWVLSFPYKRHRKLNTIYQTTNNLEVLFANDMFVYGCGDCVSESAAVALLFKELGYNDVYFCHDTGHSWVMLDGKLYDPLFAESRGFDNNYDATPVDYRMNPPYRIYIP